MMDVCVCVVGGMVDVEGVWDWKCVYVCGGVYVCDVMWGFRWGG